MKGNRKTLFAVAALAVVAALMLGLWYFTRPQTQGGAKTVVVEVVHGDESAREFTYHTNVEYLGELLLAEKLVEGEEYLGCRVTVNDLLCKAVCSVLKRHPTVNATARERWTCLWE